ncbi:serine/threonine-protein kinase prpf4B isoform X2 [Jatropha curcas]|uniref:serine/threonine-protein kinase prpf4B isoform X2 n=1 Tax=Jatropha curcas TaxID=180498 RepID=UPI0005FC2432|nr:serine/threonine-protein kinase prpf4B isoform X2 [Jatropha curcas]
MASDADASRRKHRRSPSDEEADKSSKRHKHRHHRRHHHRSHRSKKHGEESKQGGEETAPPSPPPVPVTVFGNCNDRIDDDVEEGEILEEEGSGGVGVKDIDLRSEGVGFQNLGVNADNSDSGLTNSNKAITFDTKFSLPKDSRAKIQDELVPRDGLKVDANGDLGHEYYRDGKKRYDESGSSSKGSHNRKIYGDVDASTPEGGESKLSDWGRSSSSESEGHKHKTVAAASLDRNHDEVLARSRSLSRDFARDRSRSRSIVEEEILLKRRRHDERVDNDSDDEKIARRHRYLRYGSTDLDREHGNSYTRNLGREDSHSSWDVQGREMNREKEKERRREQERERSRDRDQRREERERSSDRGQRREKERERSRDRDLRREKEREQSRDRDLRRVKDRERSRDRDLRREKEQERSKFTEIDRDWRREKQLHRSLDNEADRDWDRKREKELDRSRDREEELDQKRQKEREKSKDKDMSRASVRHRDRKRDNDRYRERDRVRDRDWESERERERRGDRNREKARDIKSDSIKVYNSHGDSLKGDRDKLERDEKEQDDFEERISLKLAEQEEDLDRVKEESRKRRQAILEKYRNQQLQQQNERQPKDVEPSQCAVQSPPASNIAQETVEIKIDDDAYVAEPSFSVGKLPPQNGKEASDGTSGAVGLGEGTPKSEGSDEKYCDDIFGETPTGVRKSGKGDGLPIVRSGLNDNWDDAEGYYGYRFGEILDGRYEIVAAHGKGVFSTVVRAKDLKAGIGEPDEVAIKIIRNNETMHKAGQTEVQILNKLAGSDPENKRHCVRFLSSFKYRNHLCLVFESLHMNLREVLKKFGRNIGLKLTAVRTYAKQLFIALKHLKNCGVLHCDIKPDNMLVNEAKNVLKLCDFGNAMYSGKNEVTPYLVSRFYRAPEIILGLTYDHPMDMWSVGCCLYELYTGKVLFPGPTNNDMLRLHMELKGPFPKKMLRKGAFIDQHFDHDLNFHAIEEDPLTKKTIKRMILNIKPKDIGSIISSSPGEDAKMLANFRDLLDKIFVLDPEKRLTVQQAQLHPFITGK